MAGLGTIFVELDLDRKKFTAAEQDVLAKSIGTTVELEKNWRNLGTKSSGYYDAMRASIEKSYAAILGSSLTTTADIVRAEEAKNAKLLALNQDQHGKQVSMLDSLKEHYVAASVAVVAAWAAVNKAVAFMDEAGQALQAESAFKIMADQAEVNADRMIAAMKAVTKETVDDSAMMTKAVKLMTLGFDPTQIERFSAVVLTAAQIAGTTAAQAFDELADAIGNRQPKAMVRMGAVTREQMELVTKAIAAGANTTVLFELAMANLEAKQKMLQGTQDQATIALQRFHAEVKQVTEDMGKALIPAFEAAYHSVQYLAAGVLGLTAIYLRYRAVVYDVLGDEQKAAENRARADRDMVERDKLLNQVADSLNGVAAAERASGGDIEKAKAIVTAKENELKAIVGAKDAEKEKAKATREAYEIAKRNAEAEEEWARVTAEAWGYVNKAEMDHWALMDKGTKDFETSYSLFLTNRVAENLQIEADEENRKAAARDKEFADIEAYRQRDLQLYFAQIDAMLAKDEEYQTLYVQLEDKKRDQAERDRKTIAQGARNAFGDMANAALAMYELTGQKHKEWFRIYQGLKIAETMIATYSAAVTAYDEVSKSVGGWWGQIAGAAAAAAVIAWGIAQVAIIAAQKPEGSAGGGGSSGPAVSGVGGSEQQSAAPEQKQEGPRPMGIQVTIIGDVVDHDKFARNLMDSIKKAQEDHA